MGRFTRIAALVLTLAVMFSVLGGIRVLAAEEKVMPRSGGAQSGSGDIDVPFDPSKTIRRIWVATQPAKKMYQPGEPLDLTGLVVKATYSDNSTAIIKNYTVSGYSADNPGTQTITVTVGKKTTTFQVTVCVAGDIDCDGKITTDDVIELLLHVSMPDMFTIAVAADFTGDGKVTTEDVIQLLLHVTMPDAFPL
jgi:hypothetical protein